VTVFSTTILVLLVVGAVLWLVRRAGPRHRDPDRVYDREALEDAEAEVRGLGPFTTPEEAQEDLPDWGPGAPKP
jgi:uncharacterized iron-regulated membrane protein